MERERSPKADQPVARGRGRRTPPRLAVGTGESSPLYVDEPADAPGPPAEPEGMCEDDVVQIVHDLRDPLATIALEAYVLDRKLASGEHSDLRSTVARVMRNVEFLDRMIQDLLDTCSAAEGHLEIRPRSVELRGLLEQVIDRVVPSRDRDRVTLEAPCRIRISIDELRIQRVVANLIGNALKYTPRDAGIVVRLEACARGVQISVTDAGPGLLPTEIEHIFDKYRRGVNARGIAGRGLGLYVCKKIIEAHGGRIGVDSIRGQGSRFYFELPVVPS